MNRGYAVVQFIDWKNGESAMAIPCSWLFTRNDEHFCYFPRRNVTKSIKNQVTAHADWDVYKIRRLTHDFIPTYALAQQSERKSFYTSAVDSDAENRPLMETSQKENG
jgi:hypothetical protein